MLLYYSKSVSSFQYCGLKNDVSTLYIPLSELQGELQLKCRKVLLAPSSPTFQAPSLPPPSANGKGKGRGKRTKERKIGEIIDKVAKWRQLYTGEKQEDGSVRKYSLEEAADFVGIAKKTLDDYLLQIRAGKKYGFDFNIHREQKVGVLRTFVKENKGRDKEGRRDNKEEEEDVYDI